MNEINILQQLDNNYLIKLYEIYESVSSVYLVMELINGGELITKLKEKGLILTVELKDLLITIN